MKKWFLALSLTAILAFGGCAELGFFGQSDSSSVPDSSSSSSVETSSSSVETSSSSVDEGHDHADSDENGSCDICNVSVVTEIDFFSINDLHGKFNDTYANIGVDEMTTYLRLAKENNANTVLLSAGDMWQGSAESNFTNGNIITDWMNDLGFAAMTVGNHEFDWGESYIEDNRNISAFPFLGINVYDRTTNKRVDYCDPSVTVETNGVQIGIIGAIGDCYSSIADEQVEDVYFKVGGELTSLVKAEATKLREEGADIIVYVLHDSEVSNSGYYDPTLSDGYVDLVFEGHSHTTVQEKDDHGVWHLQAGGDNGTGLSYAKIKINTITGQTAVLSANILNHSAYKNMEDDPIVDTLLDKYETQLQKVNEVLGTNDLYRDSDALANFTAQAMYLAGEERWGADERYSGKIVLGGGFINVRSPWYLPAQEVTYGDIYPLFPFDNPLVLCSVSGSRLKSQFINSSNYFVYYGEDGQEIVDNLDLNATYYVVVDTYCANYNFNRLGFLNIVEYYDEEHSFFNRDALARFIKDGGLTVGQNEAYTDIRDIVSSTSVYTNVAVKGEVVAKSKQSFLVSDGTGIIMYYSGGVPSVSVGDTVVIEGTTSIYKNNQQFQTSNASYAVKTDTVDLPLPSPTVWDSEDVESYDGKTGEYLQVEVNVYKNGSYYNCQALSSSSARVLSLINPSNEVLANVTIGETAQPFVVTGYACYLTGTNDRFLNVIATSITPVKTGGDGGLYSLTVDVNFGGNAISEYDTGNYGTYSVNGVTFEYYRAYAPYNEEDYAAALLPYFSSPKDGTMAGALYNSSPLYGVQSIELVYKSASTAVLCTMDDRLSSVTEYSLPASNTYQTKTFDVDTDNFFKLYTGGETLYIRSLTFLYTNQTASVSSDKKDSGDDAFRFNPVVFEGRLTAGESSVSVPVAVKYENGNYVVTERKTYTYYTLEYVRANPSCIADAAMTDPADIAAYYAAFKAFPANFAAKNFDGNDFDDVEAVFGDDTRYVSKYSRTNGYAQYVPYSTENTVYYEFDVALDPSYWEDGSRGVGRVVSWEGGWTGTGYDDAPVSVYTDDHYAVFREYLNTGVFGEGFDAEMNLTFTEWSAPTTVTPTAV